jgi:SNF2 family DNA or RNA helicase
MYSRFISHGNLSDHSYQRAGVEWCLAKEAQGDVRVPSEPPKKGAILADEMGLGKTITMLAIIALHIKTHKQTLVIVPPVLIDQWASQCASILGHVPFIFHGPHKKYIDVIPEDAYIVIASYGSMTNPTIENQYWDRIIFDEAHHMRNQKTRNFQAASKLKASFKWLLTGTPIQNKRKDLYSLFTLINIPRETFIVDENRTSLLKEYMLRRTKASVGLDKDMPPLHFHPETIKWSNPIEKQESERIHELLEFSRVKPINRGEDNSMLPNMPPIVLLLRAKQMCVMGSTTSAAGTSTSAAGTSTSAAGTSTSAAGTSTSAAGTSASAAGTGTSTSTGTCTTTKSKMRTVIKRLIKNNNATRASNNKSSSKKLVFCHFRTEMDILEEHLSNNNIKTAKIDGRISSKKARTKILADQSIEVLILQIRVGCEGLNLQQYSDVYFVSPTWNPFIEDQAIARCHRIGQKKPVNVYRFYMEGFEQELPTFSQDMYSAQVQDTKKQIEKEMLSIE